MNSRKQEIAKQALSNAVGNQSFANYDAIFEGFMEMGIPEEDITPRVNVFTYDAWLALGRCVRKGQHGVKVVTFVPMNLKDAKTGEDKFIGRKPRTTTVFHISQTDKVGV
jgi:hypothetical protein